MYTKQIQGFSQNNYFDLEAAEDAQRLTNPVLALKPLKGLVVIDEIQRSPELFPTLRVLVDEPKNNCKYLILGSASRELIRQSSESLAGRIAYLELTPFSFWEADKLERLWIRGGFPRSYLSKTEEDSFDWREGYIRTFLEQDIPNLGIQIPPIALRRFWTMLGHYHGNLFNASELGRSFGASDVTMRRYLDLLTGTFMIRQLQPWFENIGKRQVKAPKIYFRDSGIFHALMNLHTFAELQKHPKLGASWEGFALEEVIRAHQARPEECYFWSTYGEAELDLLIHQRGKSLGFEFKYSDAPGITKSMQTAVQDLNLEKLYVLYPGSKDYQLTDQIFVKGLKNYLSLLGS
jgi:predicted AAA+ superfamily ATPase